VGGAAEVLEPAVECFGGSIADGGPLEVGQHVRGPPFAGASQFARPTPRPSSGCCWSVPVACWSTQVRGCLAPRGRGIGAGVGREAQAGSACWAG